MNPDFEPVLQQIVRMSEELLPKAVGMAADATVRYYNLLRDEGFPAEQALQLTEAYLRSPAFAGKIGGQS